MAKKQKRKSGQVVGFLGIGLDNKDGEKRLTTAEHFILVGGSEETHGRMQDVVVKFEEALRKRGKPLPETPLEEVIDLFHDAHE